MSRRFAIPALQGLALLTTAACTADPVPGDWAGTRFLGYDGNAFELPFVYDYTYNGVTYTYRTEMFFSIDRQGFGFFDIYTNIREGAAFVESYTYTYALTADRLTKGNWLVSIPNYFRLELDCLADRNSMNCIGSDADGFDYDIDWVRY